MKKDFSQQFPSIYNKYVSLSMTAAVSPSKRQFAIFLGHENDGKVRSWERGQRPSAEDCWLLHKKLGCNLDWLVSGQGEPWPEQGEVFPKVVSYDTRVKPVAGQRVDAPAGPLDEQLLFAIIETLEDVANDAGKELEPSRKAEIICKLYVLFSKDTAAVKRPAVVLRLIREAVNQ